MDQTTTFADRLDALIVERGRGAASQIAVSCKIDPSYITRLRKGEQTNPSPEMIEKLATALDVSSHWLLTGQGSVKRIKPLIVQEETLIYGQNQQKITEPLSKPLDYRRLLYNLLATKTEQEIADMIRESVEEIEKLPGDEREEKSEQTRILLDYLDERISSRP